MHQPHSQCGGFIFSYENKVTTNFVPLGVAFRPDNAEKSVAHSVVLCRSNGGSGVGGVEAWVSGSRNDGWRGEGEVCGCSEMVATGQGSALKREGDSSSSGIKVRATEVVDRGSRRG